MGNNTATPAQTARGPCYNAYMLMLPEISARHGSDLLQMVRAISEKLELEEVTRRCLKFVVRLLAGQGGIISLRGEDGDFYIASELGIDPEQRPQFDELFRQLVDSLGGLTELGAAPRDKTHLEDTLNQMAASLSPEWRQTIPIALSFEQDLLGILFIFRSYHSEVTEFLGQALQTITAQAAIAIHHADLFRSVQQERQRLATLVKHSADGILILDSELRVENLNPALERMSGWPALTAYGRNYEELLAWRSADVLDLREAIAAGWPENPADQPTLYCEGKIARRDGLPFYIGVTYAPLRHQNRGKLLGVIANIRDLSRKMIEQEQQNLFISTISHELKTPVALIKGYANTLLRTDASWDRATIVEGLQVIDEEADRLDALIKNMLNASRLQAQDGFVLQPSEVDLPQLVARLAARFRTQSETHRISLRFPPDFPTIRADEDRIREVFENLLSNALKYSPAGGEVEIGGERREEEVLLFVRDEGMGIAEREKDRIFERFYRVDDKLSRSTQGAGLGLYLVKSIVSAHKGRLHLRSAPGRGSVFYFTLPIALEE